MAEREGFEPSIEIAPYTPLAGEHLRPLGQLSAQGANNITNQKKEKLFFDGFCAINNHLIVAGTENR